MPEYWKKDRNICFHIGNIHLYASVQIVSYLVLLMLLKENKENSVLFSKSTSSHLQLDFVCLTKKNGFSWLLNCVRFWRYAIFWRKKIQGEVRGGGIKPNFRISGGTLPFTPPYSQLWPRVTYNTVQNKTYICNERIFDCPPFMYAFLLASFTPESVNYSRHSESLKYFWKTTNRCYRRKMSSILEFFQMFKDSLCHE